MAVEYWENSVASNERVLRERHIEAAGGYLTLELPDRALSALNEIKDPDKCPFELNKLRGEAFRQKKQHEKALITFGRALAEKPTDLSVILGMSWCYKRTDQLPKAIAAMEQAYRLFSNESIVLYNLACYLALAGEKDQALSWLGRSLRMDGSLRELIPDESDFDQLRDDPGFQLIAGTLSDEEID